MVHQIESLPTLDFDCDRMAFVLTSAIEANPKVDGVLGGAIRLGLARVEYGNNGSSAEHCLDAFGDHPSGATGDAHRGFEEGVEARKDRHRFIVNDPAVWVVRNISGQM
jgi:hypothetical protein